MNPKELFKLYNTIAVVCNQWGDSGKGKLVDLLGEEANIIGRGRGGANAGHTISVDGVETILHLIPSGIIHDAKGTINIIGSGVAFDPREVKEEMNLLDSNNTPYNNLRIAYNANLLLPHHIVLDRIRESTEGDTKIGTTGRGIGPCYGDHALRKGLILSDLLNKDIFHSKLKEGVKYAIRQLENVDKDKIQEVMEHEHLNYGAFYDSKNIFDLDAIIEVYSGYGKDFKDMMSDTDEFMRQNVGKKKIVLEGAQGLLLSVDHGTIPYVTSSDPSAEALATGVGLKESDIDLVLGIVKAFYMTRVGEGPFPTEFGGEKSDKWCGDYSRTKELEQNTYPGVNINASGSFLKGIAIRKAGGEYGATTKRLRRTGRLDLPLLRHAMNHNGKDIVLTKVDVMDECNEIELCNSYIYTGPDYHTKGTVLKQGDELLVAPMDPFVLKHCEPVYKTFPGWNSDITKVTDYKQMPDQLKNIVNYIEKSTGANVRAVSNGPDRKQIMFRG